MLSAGLSEEEHRIFVGKSSPLPLYYQIREELLSLIRNGEFKPGDLIPPEREIGQKYQVSRITVRRAINELVHEGYLVAKQGKGTFVAAPKIHRNMNRMKSFSEQLAEEGLKPGSHLLSLRHEKACGMVPAELQLPDDSWVWLVERLRLADNEPISISRSILHLPQACALTPQELHQEISLWEVLKKKGIFLTKSSVTIQAVPAGKREAELLEVKSGAALLLVEGISFNSDDKPVEFYQMHCRADRYKYSVVVAR